MAIDYKVIGTRPVRHDGLDKVTGRAKYGADMHVTGMLHGKVLRSPHAHARIRSIDTSKALALAGVHAVVTYQDFPMHTDRPIDFGEGSSTVRILASNVLAGPKVLYKGHAVAAVAASDVHTAEAAIDLIEIDYEVLPAVFDVRAAMAPDAPLLHESMTTWYRVDRNAQGDDTGNKSNIAAHLRFERGDVDAAFRDADVVIEREYSTQTVHQGYIEPQASTAFWDQNDRLTIWTSTQNTFGVRASTAAIVGLRESRVKVVPLEIGGGFGGKLTTYIDPIVAMLSHKSKQAVKLVLSREEVFVGTGPTSATFTRAKAAATKDGRLTAVQAWMAYEAGAFPGSPFGGGAMSVFGPYKVENLRIDAFDVVLNHQKTQSYRAPGQPQATFAAECLMDELAQELGIDPLELRLRNVIDEGDPMTSGMPIPSNGCRDVELAMKEHAHFKTPLTGPNRGRGIAMAYRFNNGGVSSATMHVNDDGTVNLVTGAVDIGGTRTSVAMQAAECLGLQPEDIVPTVVDTDTIGWTGSTGGSRVTFDTGLAAVTVAKQIVQLMAARFARIREVDAAEIEFESGVFFSRSNPDVRIGFKELAGKLRSTGGPITASASNATTGVGPIFAGNIVDVEVDPDTGKVEILRFTAFMDAGTAVHPSYVEGQLQGGSVQGIGWALNEEYFFGKDGELANPTFLDYRMPTTLDVPMIDSVLIEVPNPRHPYGLRGVGEIPIVPPLAAVANAVSRAIGVRLRKLPLKPGVILEAIEEKAATAD